MRGGGHKLEVTFFDPLIFYFFIGGGGAKKCKLGGRENVTYIFWRGGPPYLFVTYIFWPPPKKKLPKGVGILQVLLVDELPMEFHCALQL